ncbi:MAG: nitroreductase family deazaflavin-dependent oxidoreductase [Anaerolineae bacterium]|jgi:deazaflavin-dependent oxidoreductase (nitroreductase family)|nr:nitroreductase family deazaflavin-dependent oxidoreductase [Anaerolineae bacterium]MBT7192068.1 nitroreductase family deazaflavin-dependent oxidoreductase [Anaerolineae bacterium]MBT7990144.1 nitroreductase family deazaflavin-dependent oxidoreductase [Anaerolineae bacterium]
MKLNWQRMKYIQKLHRVLYAIGLGPIVGKLILLLTTTGRKSGLKRVTPLQYEEIDGKYYLGSARGLKADWVRNIQADSQVEIRVKSLRFQGQAEVIDDPARLADFVEIRLERHPRMIGLLMEKVHGLSKNPTREELEKLAETEALVTVTPNKIKDE